MVISSIDLKDGKVVQLKNGKDLILERDNPLELIAEFNKYGETAVIDLDAALGNADANGATANTKLLESLLRLGSTRVGGGIRDVKKAKRLISLGAEKIIIGSAAFKRGENGGGSRVNAEFLEALNAAIGKDRIVIAVDALNEEIVVSGWTEKTGIDLITGAREASKYCGELLFTCVEREGTMSGFDANLAARLRENVDCRVTAAGGVNSVGEIAALEKIGCDVQLGMALYTGAVSLADAFIACLNWDKVPLIPVVAQSEYGEALMLGYANKEAFEKTFKTGKLTFFSRTRNALWTKGETSGNTLDVIKLRADCDRDTVLAVVHPEGPVCHTGARTCFSSISEPPYTLELLRGVIADRLKNPAPGSYTATLDDERVREKIQEEAEELIEAETKEEIIWEFADLLYFMTVLMCRENVSWTEIINELDRRRKK